MWQRNHPQDQPAKPPASSKAGNSAPRGVPGGRPPEPAQRAVQVALDRRDNGGDVHPGDDE
jgi:hypothetical protein